MNNLDLIDLFDTCANRRNYTTVKSDDGKYEVDYKFLEDDESRTLYIFFEPSDGDVDWRVNFSYWRKPYKDMKIKYRVHGGFLQSWKMIHDEVRYKIVEKRREGGFRWKRIVIAGYSHGGALAALCHECAWFEREDLREEGLIGVSFDGPRVYGGLWVPKALKTRWHNFYIIRNQNDLVTHLPPVVFFFRHVGNKVKIGDTIRPKGTVLKEWIKSSFKDKILFQELVGVKPHYPDEIRKSLMGLQSMTSENWIPGIARLFQKWK